MLWVAAVDAASQPLSPLVLVPGAPAVLGRAKKGQASDPHGLAIRDHSISRKQATLTLAPATGVVSVLAGGVNPLAVVRGGHIIDLHKESVLALTDNDVVELDGFKRMDGVRYVAGPVCAFKFRYGQSST